MCRVKGIVKDEIVDQLEKEIQDHQDEMKKVRNLIRFQKSRSPMRTTTEMTDRSRSRRNQRPNTVLTKSHNGQTLDQPNIKEYSPLMKQ